MRCKVPMFGAARPKGRKMIRHGDCQPLLSLLRWRHSLRLCLKFHRLDAAPIILAPHRAVYDLKLLRAPGRRPIEAVRGRILYDFAGNSCEGYALQFRQVSELDAGEGKVIAQRSARDDVGRWRGARISVSPRRISRPQLRSTSVDGNAERKADGVAVNLNKPAPKTLDLDAGMVFPAEHMRRIIEAALDGKTLLELPVYDGSETGEKVFNTLTVIGHEIAPGEKVLNDASAKIPALAEAAGAGR